MFAMSATKAFVSAPKAAGSTTRGRKSCVSVRAAQMHGKGGEEGARALNNDAFGMIAKNANFGLFGTAISKVIARTLLPHSALDHARPQRSARAQS